MALFEKSKRSGKSKREPSRRRTGVPQFDPAHFFETSATGRSISTHRKNEIIFSQGDAADAVFYIKKARSKSPSYPSKVRKPWLRFWARTSFWARVA